MYEQTGDSRHHLKDTADEGNFVSRQRLLSCSREGGIIVRFDQLFLGLDWGRVSDQTIATVGNNQNDVLDWFAYPTDRPLASTFEDQTIKLVREYKDDGEYLSVHHPDEPGARDDYPDSTALMAMGTGSGSLGEILFA
jgi:hypothetical protein